MKKYCIKCLKSIGQDIAEYSSWDMAQPVAKVSSILKDGGIDQCVAMVLGDLDPKRFDAISSVPMINLVGLSSMQLSFGSYLNSLFRMAIVSFILQFLTHNSPEHRWADALNCTVTQ